MSVSKSEGDQTRGERWTATGRLLRAYRERGDRRARDRVAQLYLPLVDAFARRHESAGASYDELMEAGSIGLMDAIDRYVPRPDDEFIGFAAPIIAGHVRNRLPESARDLPVKFDLRDERLRLAGAFRTLDETEQAIVLLRLIDGLSGEEAASRLGMSEAEVSRHAQAALAKVRGALERLGSGQPPADQPPATGSSVPPPEPAAKHASDRHSGRLLLRMPRQLHTELAEAAEQEQVSLNQFITNTLAAAVGWQETGDQRDTGAGAASRTPASRWVRVAIVVNLVVLAIAVVLAAILLVGALQDW